MKKLLFAALALAFFGCEKMETTQLDFVSRRTSTGDELTRIVMRDSLFGYACGGKIWETGFIFRTESGGMNWFFDPFDGLPGKLFGLTKDAGGTFYAVGTAGELWKKSPGDDRWYRWRQDWRWNRGAAFWSENRGIVVQGEGFRGGLAQEIGPSFSLLGSTEFPQELDDVALVDSATAVAVGYGLVIRSTDGGKSWERAEPTGDHFQKVVFPTSKTGFAIGLFGSILKSEDGGASWRWLRKSRSASGGARLRGLHFFDEKTGCIVGDAGLFWLTRDGGETFLEVENARSDVDFRDVFLFKNKGLAVGTAGAVEEFSF